jgi:hypothetical protein
MVHLCHPNQQESCLVLLALLSQFFFHIQNLHHLDLEIVVLVGISIVFVQRIKCANGTEPVSDAKRLGRVNPAAPLRMHDIGFAFGLG